MTAVQQLLIEQFDTWTAADSEKKSGRGRSAGAASVYGIKKLRELILELAVRGKLVPQDLRDEPASELLKRIRAEKAKLAAEGKIRQEKPLSPITDEDEPFTLPAGWVACRWNAVALKIGDIDHKMPETVKEGIPYVSPRDFYPGNVIDFGGAKQISRQDYLRLAEKIKPDLGDLIYPRYGTIGENRLVEVQREFLVSYSCAVIKIMGNFISPKYQYYFSVSPYCKLQAKAAENKTTQANVGIASIQEYIFPLPPLPEQRRIVAKVDELMSLCDQLETQHNSAAEAHEKLVSQLLTTLTQSQSADDFATNWQRIAAHFDTLFTTEQSIDALKQTLLQLAVMGKLVPQDSNDEPAGELLKKIQAEKARLFAEGKIKKEKPLLPISGGEKPFELPVGWEWVRLDTISHVGTGATPLRSKHDFFDPPDISWVTSGETSNSFISKTEQYVSPLAIENCNLTVYPPGTLIVAMYGQGKTRGQITELMIEACTNQACAAIQLLFADDKHRRYVKIFFEKIYDEIRELAAGGAQPNLNLGMIKQTLLPLPPTDEQRRIVAKLDELMFVCDQLKSHLADSNKLQQNLADALVEGALSNKMTVSQGVEVPEREESQVLLGAEIVHLLHNEKTFGQVKLQKLLHLCEHHAKVDAVAGEYLRFAAGPYDAQMIKAVETGLKQHGWYEEYVPKSSDRHAYRPLKNAGKHRKQFDEEYWGDKLLIIRKLIETVRIWKTEKCEIFSTAYAAWNDLLIWGKPVSDEAILDEILNRWHEKKRGISEKDWLAMMIWMRDKGYVPTGFGKATRQPSLFES